MKKFISVVLGIMMLIMLSACSNNNATNSTETPVGNPNDGIIGETITTPTVKPDDGGPMIEQDALGEDLCVTKDDVVFGKVLNIDGNEFKLGCKFEEFLAKIDGNCLDSDEFSAFQNDTSAEKCWVDCVIVRGEKNSTFKALVEHDEDGNMILRTVIFESTDTPLSEFCVDVMVLGVNINDGDFNDYEEKYRNVAKKLSSKNGYSLTLISYYDDYSYYFTFECNDNSEYVVTRVSISGK